MIGIRQLREELASVMGELAGRGELVITQRGEGKAVLVDLRRYNDLIQRLEYLEDSLDALEGAREGAIPIDQLA